MKVEKNPKARRPSPLRSAHGLTNGNGMTNGMGKGSPQMRGPGATNGLTNGLGGGGGRTNGLTNGMGRTNGLTNGNAPPIAPRRHRGGRTRNIMVVATAALALAIVLSAVLAHPPHGGGPQTDPYAAAPPLALYDEAQSYGLYADDSALYVLVNLSTPVPDSTIGIRAFLEVKDHPRPYRFQGVQASHRLDIPFSDPEQPTLYTHGGQDEYDIAGWTDPLAPGYSIPCPLDAKARGGFMVYRIDAYKLRGPETRNLPDLNGIKAVFSLITELPDGSFVHSRQNYLPARADAASSQTVGQPSRTATLHGSPRLSGNVTGLEVRDGTYSATLGTAPYSGAAPISLPSPQPETEGDGGERPGTGSTTPQEPAPATHTAIGDPAPPPPTYSPKYAFTQFWVNGSVGGRSYIYHENETIALDDTGYFSIDGAEVSFDSPGVLESFAVSGPGLRGAASFVDAPPLTKASSTGYSGRVVSLGGTGTIDSLSGTIASLIVEDYDDYAELQDGYFWTTGFSRSDSYCHYNASSISSVVLHAVWVAESGYSTGNALWYRNGTGSQTWLNSTIQPTNLQTWQNQSTNITELYSTWTWADIEDLELYYFSIDGNDYTRWEYVRLEIKYDIGQNVTGTCGLVINEVLYNPQGAADGAQWVEIYNGGTGTIYLGDGSTSSYYISNANGTRKAYLTGSIASDSYMVAHLNASGTNDSDECYPAVQDMKQANLDPDDTHIIGGSGADENYGGSANIKSGVQSTLTYRSIFKTDLSSYASLDLLEFYAYVSGSGGSAVSVSAHRMTADWDEGTDIGINDPALDGCTWNHADRDPLTDWTDGGDYDSTKNATVNVPTAVAYAPPFDITDLGKRWLDSTYSNYGIMLRADTESDGDYITWVSDEFTDETYDPYFKIVYADGPQGTAFNASGRDGCYLYAYEPGLAGHEPVDFIAWNASLTATSEADAVNYALWTSGAFIDTDTNINNETIGLSEYSYDSDAEADWELSGAADPYGINRTGTPSPGVQNLDSTEVIPEFSDIAVPCAALIIIFAVIRRKRRANNEKLD